MRSVKHQIKLLMSSSCCLSCDKLAIEQIKEKQMKGFHKNSRRIENEVFILYMSDHELVNASNLQKNPNCFELSLFFFGMEYLRNPHNLLGTVRSI